MNTADIYKIPIKDIVKDNTVHFSYLRHNVAYYKVDVKKHQITLEFPVPLDDIGTATLFEKDKAILYMRYIRKAIEDFTLIEHR